MASAKSDMANGDGSIISILVSGFRGLDMPKTLSLGFPATTKICDVHSKLMSHLSLDSSKHRIAITTPGRTEVVATSHNYLSTILPSSERASLHPMVTLLLTPATLGGKGGFGSQLRAAGGRMSSRKNKRNAQTEEQRNGSNRNLDGRRIRTITEAKNLATYLAMKPDMDKKEREEKRKRWEAVVDAAERREDEVKRGKGGNVRLDGQWVEQKEEVEAKTRDAVLAAMKAGLIGNEAPMLERTGSETSASAEERDSDGVMEEEAASSSSDAEEATSSKPTPASAAPSSRTFFGWDEDDEDMSDEEDDEEDEQSEEHASTVYEGKGKGKA